MTNYIEILGEYFPDTQAYVVGDPTAYANVVWVTAQVPQADIDAANLTKCKTEAIMLFSEYARDEIVSGFFSSALGYPHEYDSEPEDQLNLIGAAATEGDVYFSCRPSTQGYQVVNVGGMITGGMSTGFANSGTTYNCEIQVDGVSTYISAPGQDIQTYATFVAYLNADADFMALATASLDAGNIKITSKLYGASSAIYIADIDLFSTLTNYVGLNAAVGGKSAADGVKEFKNHAHMQLLQVLNDGKDIKLTVLQKYAVKKAQILAATTCEAVALIVW